MSTDLRGLLRDLAEDAPPIDNRIGLADRLVRRGWATTTVAPAADRQCVGDRVGRS